MKLLLSDERCNNLLQDTIALLQFLKQNKAQICQLKIEVSKEVRQHSLVLPNSCIKGTDDIYEFFVKYIGLGQSSPQPRLDPEQSALITHRPQKMGTVDDNADLQSYYKSAIDAGDEQQEQVKFQQRAPAGKQQQTQQPAQPVQQAQARPQTHPAARSKPVLQPDSDDEMDVHDLLADTLKRGGTI